MGAWLALGLSSWHKTSVVSPEICNTLNPWKFNDRLFNIAGEFCVTHGRCPLCPYVDPRSTYPRDADGCYARVHHPASQCKLDFILVWKRDCWGRSLVDLMTTLHDLTA